MINLRKGSEAKLARSVLDLLDVFLFVFVCHIDIASTWLQVDRPNLAKAFIFGRESGLDNTLDVVFPLKLSVLH